MSYRAPFGESTEVVGRPFGFDGPPETEGADSGCPAEARRFREAVVTYARGEVSTKNEEVNGVIWYWKKQCSRHRNRGRGPGTGLTRVSPVT